jgi:hypothetical protein
VDGRTESEWILGRLIGGVEWIQLAQDRDRQRAVVNAVMNLRILSPRGYYFVAKEIMQSLTSTEITLHSPHFYGR